MRLIERTLINITVHARQAAAGSMGGRARTFASAGTAVRASLSPRGGDLQGSRRGDAERDALRVIVPGDTQVSVGDGVRAGGRMYIVRAANRWTAHIELECEAVPCAI